jgi:uncharacterized protein
MQTSNFHRLLSLPVGKHSFFLFGPRQTGKTTLIESLLDPGTTFRVNLLETDTFLKYHRDPSLFRREVSYWCERLPKSTPGVVFVDEVQKCTALLDETQGLMDHWKAKLSFVLSGSSARKLKRSSANLLGGRAWSFALHPLTHLELANKFHLPDILQFGALPPIITDETQDRMRTLRSYTQTYLKEEVFDEALVRNLPAFSRFMELAADQSGMPVNYSNIASETGVRSKTIREYYQILEDTLLAFPLMPYLRSARKRLTTHPIYYLFDTGVINALCGRLDTTALQGTALHGRLFEHFVLLELRRLIGYLEKEWHMYYWRTSNGAEVDLVLDTGRKLFAVEVKSGRNLRTADLKGLVSFREDHPHSELICVCQADRPFALNGIRCLPWRDFFAELLA